MSIILHFGNISFIWMKQTLNPIDILTILEIKPLLRGKQTDGYHWNIYTSTLNKVTLKINKIKQQGSLI